MGDTPLSVGACHMYRLESLFGMIQITHNGLGVVEVGLIGGSTHTMIGGQGMKEIVYGFLVVH